MPRRNALLPSFVLLGSDERGKNKSLSENALRRLKHVVKIVSQMEVQLANELYACKQVETLREERHIKNDRQKLLTSDEMRKFIDFHSRVMNELNIVATIRTQGEIRTYLCNDECVTDWLLVATAMSRIQNRYVVLDGSIAVWDECRNRAEVLLDLGVSLIEHLQPIKADLQEVAEDILFALRMKLNAIKAFHPIFQNRRHQESLNFHEFINLLPNFNQDNPPAMNVAEAYPLTDKPLQAILIAATVPVLIICMIPTFIAWQRSPTKKGSRDDPDFWAILQAQLMQLLNLFTMMFPVSRFMPAVAWRLAWVFAIAAGMCAIATPILYVTVPVGWSLLASYVASAAQAVVVLEIMLKSKYFKGKTA